MVENVKNEMVFCLPSLLSSPERNDVDVGTYLRISVPQNDTAIGTYMYLCDGVGKQFGIDF